MVTADFRRISLPPGSVALDAGCGAGRHTVALLRIPGVTAVGIDRNVSAVAQTRDQLLLIGRLGEARGKAHVLIGDVGRLSFPDETFDLVLCSEVLEHIADDRGALRELVRVLKPGKEMVVTVPRFGPETICWALSREYAESQGGHVRIYRKQELTRLLESTGLVLLGSHFAHGLHSPYWWLKCLVGPTRHDSLAVNWYHRFLVWDLMKRPFLSRALERIVNPIMGKSLVLYLQKPINGPGG